MAGIVMFDSVSILEIPAGAQAVAGYVDGAFANVAELRDRFPRAHVLSIAVFADHDADCLDIETGDATPGEAAGWYARQKARGAARPCLYASASVMQEAVIPAIRAAGMARSEVRLWSAHYGAGAHICAPSSCGLMSISADGTQHDDRALGRNLDQSLLAADFFGAVPAQNWTETLVNTLPTLQLGSKDTPGHVFYVHRMQSLLACVGRIKSIPSAACIIADGEFGAGTAAGLKAVQASFGIAQDGVCGPASWGVLVAGSAT